MFLIDVVLRRSRPEGSYTLYVTFLPDLTSYASSSGSNLTKILNACHQTSIPLSQ
ncbi:MAG: hypothetical protein LAT84_08510 [Balneolia bacterium]|nr:hypothetical protein [Balneolia bacterium]